MPYMQMVFQDETQYKKYLEPKEFSKLVKNNFSNWKQQAIEYFEKTISS